MVEFYQADIVTWVKRYPPKQYACFIFPTGEKNKNMLLFQELLQFLLENQFSRALNIVAIGGGVLGDLTGFVASCYLRGVHFIYCPTTLLAQIDASIGGKTAINMPEGKNLIGAFYPPERVICDSYFLKTLPEREFRAGLAEAIKHGLLSSKFYVDWLKENADAILNREPAALIYLIEESIRIKGEIVAKDSLDKAERQWLNFGHTIGHALESAMHYEQYLHGEAVAVGMVAALKLSEQQLGLSPGITKAVIELLIRFELPVKLDNVNLTVEKIMRYLKLDKKKRVDKLNWVLLKEIGHPVLTPIELNGVFEESIKEVLFALGAR